MVFKQLMKSKKERILLMIILFIVLLSIYWITNSIGSLFFYLSLLVISVIYRENQMKKLAKMWQLSDQLGLSVDELSQLSSIGRLDLMASKPINGASYYPPSRLVKQTIQKLEQLT